MLAMNYLLKLFIGVILSGSFLSIEAQNTIPATGGNATGTGGSVSYTVGQIVYTKNTGTTGSVSQGVQQPYEISVITSLETFKNINLETSVYPNPASDILKLKIENNDVENLTFQLYDINGTILQNNKVESTITDINMTNYVPAVYFLKVMQGKKEVKTFKVIKN
jgi:hypothetical protein